MLNIKRLDIEDATVLIAAARGMAQEIDVPMCIAVTDESGNLIAFERMDGGKITSIHLAIDQGFTASHLCPPLKIIEFKTCIFVLTLSLI